MRKKRIDQVEVRGKKAFVRVDFNVPMDGGVITDDRRIKASLPTIRSVLSRGGRAV
ncbi:MAG: phosphoglycerate kinase, partial [Planctomycetota bacterium]|nr:phosphoglycerate kinase [Planctomycetota bacterium]